MAATKKALSEELKKKANSLRSTGKKSGNRNLLKKQNKK
jgi:hypothetical protein